MTVLISFCMRTVVLRRRLISKREWVDLHVRNEWDGRHSWGVTLTCSSPSSDDDPKDGREMVPK